MQCVSYLLCSVMVQIMCALIISLHHIIIIIIIITPSIFLES